MRRWREFAVTAALLSGATPAFAVEGGSGAYLLGTRDLLAGVVPPPGEYVNLDVIHIQGNVEKLPISGVALTNAEIEAWIAKAGVTFVSPRPLMSGRAALNVQVPFASVNMDFTGVLGGLIAGTLSDAKIGMADPTVTPMLGWDSGSWHWNVSMPVYVPIGYYDTATIKLGRPPDVSVVSLGKNKWAFDPTFAWTWLDPKIGFEFSGAVGLTLSTMNEATDYQTAPELHVELTAGQHFKNGAALGLTGYYYQQTGNDSGNGAEKIQKVLEIESLQARVFGIGPVLNWNTEIGTIPVILEAKYLHELGAKRRFESEIIWGSVTFAFR